MSLHRDRTRPIWSADFSHDRRSPLPCAPAPERSFLEAVLDETTPVSCHTRLCWPIQLRSCDYFLLGRGAAGVKTKKNPQKRNHRGAKSYSQCPRKRCPAPCSHGIAGLVPSAAPTALGTPHNPLRMNVYYIRPFISGLRMLILDINNIYVTCSTSSKKPRGLLLVCGRADGYPHGVNLRPDRTGSIAPVPCLQDHNAPRVSNVSMYQCI